MSGRATPPSIPAERLRRIALDRQGLTRAAAFGSGRAATLRAIEQIGYVQIDTISVVERAHHHVLRTRVRNYATGHLDRLQREGRVFEYWFHAAAYLPMRDYRFALPRMRAMASHDDRWVRSRDRKVLAEVLRRVADEGPLKARDFEAPAGHRGGWWNWKPAKAALEQLFMQGDLMSIGRDGFEKVYDLTERVLPAGVGTTPPTDREMAAHLLDIALGGHGFASARSALYLRRGKALRVAFEAEVRDRVASRALVPFRLPSGTIGYADPEILEGRAPPAPGRVRILSPFDNLLIQRDRTRALFGFDYQLECYVPAPKRRYGYFCLPLLYRDRLVGRIDCKALRPTGRLEVRTLFIEDARLARRDDAFEAALGTALVQFAKDNACTALAGPLERRVVAGSTDREPGPG